MSHLITVFVAVFLAELGDKTQLAALLFAADGAAKPWLVFAAASAALVLATGLAVLLGTLAGRHLHALPMKLIAGLAFVAIGAWMTVDHLRSAG